ncbi:MAG: polysaccharide deacetylase family protein [Chloroflexi bacterium]|uniref:Polysaccharide deacetylase n=1 Tax=Candidatus Thermofonsia Clade 3 bacterium TaxID=2364212 RepID=A0A2M8QF63_9CHLR|nr:MAG: polysaccharide deacetylase [Candidatus Thermofonsia Clade 3 bacterium]RMG66160.1 MAG: polysaccharide deacetylase family protein [Chloroflexota bacterium]
MFRLARVALVAVLSLAFVWVGLCSGRPAFGEAKLPPEDQPPATLPPHPTSTAAPTATATPARLPASARVPILMYHYISEPPPGADRYRIDLSVAPQDFEQQLQYLAANGYTTISLYDLYAHLKLGRSLPPKPIVLTFDDGYRDHYEHAFPLLQKYGMRGTFFITTDFINFGNPNYLTWEMVKEMSAAGMDIESHARTHRDLRNRDFQFLVWEILGPIEQITAHTGKRPRFFCYPSGRYDDAVIRMLRSVQTWAAVTTEHGSVHTLANGMTWRRIRVHGRASLERFAATVRSAGGD